MEISLSVIMPAYNESRRLPPFLTSVRRYLDERYPDCYEVIVVDDGSRDGLPEVLASAAADWPGLLAMRHPTNLGKGAAVRTGMLAARGRLLLFADADGATPIDQEAKLYQAILDGADIAVGSRLLAAAGVVRRRSPARCLAGRLFAGLARRWLRIAVRDTQCGFKMFRREAGRKLFRLQQESGYLFDLELLTLADRLGYTTAEVPVTWTEMPGGHLSPARELPRLLLGLWRLKRRLHRGEAELREGIAHK